MFTKLLLRIFSDVLDSFLILKRSSVQLNKLSSIIHLNSVTSQLLLGNKWNQHWPTTTMDVETVQRTWRSLCSSISLRHIPYSTFLFWFKNLLLFWIKVWSISFLLVNKFLIFFLNCQRLCCNYIFSFLLLFWLNCQILFNTHCPQILYITALLIYSCIVCKLEFSTRQTEFDQINHFFHSCYVSLFFFNLFPRFGDPVTYRRSLF